MVMCPEIDECVGDPTTLSLSLSLTPHMLSKNTNQVVEPLNKIWTLGDYAAKPNILSNQDISFFLLFLGPRKTLIPIEINFWMPKYIYMEETTRAHNKNQPVKCWFWRV